jgi:hypothetical protein
MLRRRNEYVKHAIFERFKRTLVPVLLRWTLSLKFEMHDVTFPRSTDIMTSL